MERTDLADTEPERLAGTDRVSLSELLSTTGVAINRYRIPPGEGLPSGLHAHADQEELFVVLDGEATFETAGSIESSDRRGELVTVEADAAVRFAPGEFQSGYNAGNEVLEALAIGAPADSEDVRIPFPCPDCEATTLRLDTDGGVTVRCPDCSAAFTPDPCPDCGGGNLTTELDDDRRPVAVCEDCGASFDRPPATPE
jgi:uncharacterized cupin superfamily protein